jgi:hypothetical protein
MNAILIINERMYPANLLSLDKHRFNSPESPQPMSERVVVPERVEFEAGCGSWDGVCW